MTLVAHLHLLLIGFSVIGLIMVALWYQSERISDPSFIDAFWSMGFVILAWLGYWQSGLGASEMIVLPVVASIWGLRLAKHLFDRWCLMGKDPRYEKILEGKDNPSFFSLWFIFGLQGLLILIIGWPLLVAPSYGGELGLIAIIGMMLFAIGFLFEAIGDKQLKAFRNDPESKGKVLDTGLWRYTRHPNYFGDATLWWGMWLIAFDMGAPIFSIICPAIMSFLLLKWSGVPLLERSMQKTRPKYADYAARTSAFFPLPPKKKAD